MTHQYRWNASGGTGGAVEGGQPINRGFGNPVQQNAQPSNGETRNWNQRRRDDYLNQQNKPTAQSYRYSGRDQGQEKKDWAGVTRIIDRINGKDRVMDFRDGLTLSGVEEYASIHRRKSGKENGVVMYASVIPITLCDYSVKPSITVRANVTPQVCKEWLEAAKEFIARPVGLYVYQQERLNFHQQDQNGRCPYTQLRVTYEQGVDGTGNLQSKYPWNIQITKTTAVAQKRPNGAVCAASGSIDKSAKPIFIRVSNSDFFATLDNVCEFVRIWNDTYGPSLLRQGKKQLEEQERDQ